VRLLLDTHALLWALSAAPELGPQAVGLISDPANEVFVSVVSLWEATLKIRIGKLAVKANDIMDAVPASGFVVLDLKPDHLRALEKLPRFADHKDPFDHLLIAQATAEDLAFMSQDANVIRYRVRRILCAP
jgi:PIN domain nuclease of toxin-antitoxin system